MPDPPGRKALSLTSALSEFGGWAKRSLPALRALGVTTVADLLHHYPRRYIDRSDVAKIGDLRIGQEATFIATVRKVRRAFTRRRQVIVTVTVWDGTGYIDLSWFNQAWPATRFREGQEVAVSGKTGAFRGRLRVQNPAVEILKGGEADQVHTGRIVPVHPAAEGVSTGTIRRLVHDALRRVRSVPDSVPADVRKRHDLLPLSEALSHIHFPDHPGDIHRARERLKFDELFFLELGVAFRKHRVEAETRGVPHDPTGELAERFVAVLPFELTSAQRRAIDEVAKDMAAPRPMNRLLQGDVGSGKTVIALHACLIAIQSGHQAAIMAPTEVLAGQHLRKAEELLGPLGARRYGRSGDEGSRNQANLFSESEAHGAPTYALLTASVTGKERERVNEGVGSGDVDLLVGTHALVQQTVAFKDLSLAVIDEQHRFGLHQRIALKEKGPHPDVLIMTATPIPRTLALTYYGDLDVSVLDEMPPGRQPATTRVARTDEQRQKAYDLVREQVGEGRQAFVVCAAIDEENRLEVKAAEKEADRLATEVFPDLRIALLHGRMRPKEKDRVMESFRAGEAHLLISTTVIEVGVDVPNATVMLVENAERFGLAQLHQLRGRIGRSGHPSWCVLFDESSPENEEARGRIEAVAKTSDGFELADEDLRLRGEGTLFDIRQSGMPDLRLARLAYDTDLVRLARTEAFSLIESDPDLSGHQKLRAEMQRRFADSIDWLFHS
ncbi:MAG TPA: ATP-dependent DNA helicase RecG [Actinomycetota bacterium]|nr:ATP-dependent DNA helicase RecG [Actinomycetota bacterium]